MKKTFIALFFLQLFAHLANAQLKYANPILAGFYPDPSICKVNQDYYLVNSSFAYFPGLPLFHSTDLVNWKQIGHALERNEQLDLSNAGISRGLFAPTIRYHDSTFYIVCTLIDKKGNFIIKAKDPKGPWSNPVWLNGVYGIDPSLFFDNDGKAYITFNGNPPDNKSLYSGHRSIRIVEFDVQKMKVVGNNEVLVNGGVDFSRKPIWIEGPHIFKKDNYYYLICAEGGTGSNHTEVVLRSDSVKGPYIPYRNNPILTQKDLDPNRQNPISSAGHCDFIEAQNGKWFSVFLGCRPYQDDFYNTGRETFLAPIEWKDGWPIITHESETIQYQYPVPLPSITKKISNDFSGNFSFRDDFKSKKLNDRFVFLRNPTVGLYTLDTINKQLILPLKATTLSEKYNPAFVGFRQSHLKGEATTSVGFNAKADNEKAGLVVFQNETHYYFICKSIKENNSVVELYRSALKEGEINELITTVKISNKNKSIQFKIEANNDQYSFYYCEEGKKYVLLKTMDAKLLSTYEAGGFVGALYGLYSTSNGTETQNTASYHWFAYKGNDTIYK